MKTPEVYRRDTVLPHMLCGLPTLEHVLGHPLCRHSWEGYCIEQILSVVPKEPRFSQNRTHAKAEVDPVLESSHGDITAEEITPSLPTNMETLEAIRGYYITPGGESYPLAPGLEAVSASPQFHTGDGAFTISSNGSSGIGSE